MKSAQNLSPGRFRHAEAESEVKNLQNFHPDLEMKENGLDEILRRMIAQQREALNEGGKGAAVAFLQAR